MSVLTQELLKKVVIYDQDTGIFTRKESVGKNKAGTVLGSRHSKGYLNINIKNKTYYAHRLAFLYIYGYTPEGTVDHINRDRIDNRISNLREVSKQCQVRNCKVPNTNISGVKGIHQIEGEYWIANLSLNHKTIYLGCSKDKVEAACMRFSAEQCLGFIDCDSRSSAKMFIDRYLAGLK